MKRVSKTIGLALVVVCAMAAIASAASAASFEASAVPKPLKGHSTSTSQVFTTNGGTVSCTGAATTGEATEKVASHQAVIVTYSGCKAFSIVNVKITPAHYDLFASGKVNITSPITITVEGGILGNCTVNVPTQEAAGGKLSSVSYESPGSTIIEKSAVTGITYTTSGGLCGSGGSNGTYTGNNEVELEGGTLKFIP